MFRKRMLGRRGVPSSKSCSRRAPATQRLPSLPSTNVPSRVCIGAIRAGLPALRFLSSPLLSSSYLIHTLFFSLSAHAHQAPSSSSSHSLDTITPLLSFHLHRSCILETRPRLRASCAHQQPTSMTVERASDRLASAKTAASQPPSRYSCHVISGSASKDLVVTIHQRQVEHLA